MMGKEHNVFHKADFILCAHLDLWHLKVEYGVLFLLHIVICSPMYEFNTFTSAFRMKLMAVMGNNFTVFII